MQVLVCGKENGSAGHSTMYISQVSVSTKARYWSKKLLFSHYVWDYKCFLVLKFNLNLHDFSFDNFFYLHE